VRNAGLNLKLWKQVIVYEDESRVEASELLVLRMLSSVVVNVGAEVTGIPRKEMAAEVEPSVVARAFVMPEAVEPTGTLFTGPLRVYDRECRHQLRLGVHLELCRPDAVHGMQHVHGVSPSMR
jgi:hypothetical protein